MRAIFQTFSILTYFFSVSIYSHFLDDKSDGGLRISFFGDQNLDLVHFYDEQSFIERFGDDEEISNIFKNRTKYKSLAIPGDMGKPVILENPTNQIKLEIEKGFAKYGYNKYVSDIIPIQRKLPDTRNDWCFAPNRLASIMLPTSIIVCFYNEALSVLLRTIYSIINNNYQSHLVAEIILIDDFSTHDELKEKLNIAIQHLEKVKLFRLPKREGLIRCRLIGAVLAHAPILTFLDSHIEAQKGWLEPLLSTVTKSWKTIAVPVMNYIDAMTFSVNFTKNKPVESVGGFKWADLMFTFRPIPKRVKDEIRTPADPIPSPIMSGGFFSIHKDFFDYLGKYDEGFEIWGGENIELSIKAWMCGGRIEILPCSHVAHLERVRAVYSRESVKRNNARLAAVWFEDYAMFYFHREPKYKDATTYGDIQNRLELKRKLNCSSFDWYMNNIVPDVFNPKSSVAFGELRNLDQQANGLAFCLDSHEGKSSSKSNTVKTPDLYWQCHNMKGNQFWYFTIDGEIRNEQKCLDYFGGESVALLPCHGGVGNQQWEHHADTGTIVHSESELCLTLNKSSLKLEMKTCQGKLSQKWQFEVNLVHNALKNIILAS